MASPSRFEGHGSRGDDKGKGRGTARGAGARLERRGRAKRGREWRASLRRHRVEGGGEVPKEGRVGGAEELGADDGVNRRDEGHDAEGVADGQDGGGEGVDDGAEGAEAVEDAEDAEDPGEPEQADAGDARVRQVQDRHCARNRSIKGKEFCLQTMRTWRKSQKPACRGQPHLR